MTSSCLIKALLYFAGVPLAVTVFVRAIYGFTNQLAPPIIDDMPSFSRMFIMVALSATAVWIAHCHLGIPLTRGSGCVCD